MNISHRLRRAYRQAYRAAHVHGVLGTLRLAASKLSERSGDRSRHDGGSGRSAFDSIWNVHTDGNEDLSELEVVDKTHYLLGSRYQPTSPEVFQRILEAYPLPYHDCIFIDCGSGKGRVLLLASELPFRRIIGVEFAVDLHNIARANLLAYQSPTQRCREIELICMDATRYALPPEPTVLYMQNPFEGAVMRAFVTHMEASLRQAPRPVYVLYRNPQCAYIWDDSPAFVKVRSSHLYAIYCSVS